MINETMLRCMISNAEERASIWEKVADSEKSQHSFTKEAAWQIMARGVKEENEFGDLIGVHLSAADWRELSAIVNFGR